MGSMPHGKEASMKTLLRFSKGRVGLPGLLMATWLAALGTSAMAAPTPTFTATASGAASDLTVVANVGIGDADAGQPGSIYLAADIGSGWYLHNGTGWIPWTSGPLPTYYTGTLSSRSFDVIRNTDLSFLGGTQVYVGYGRTESDMLTNSKLGLIYSVPSVLQSSEIDSINTALSSGMNAIAAAYGSSGLSQGFAALFTQTIPFNGQIACPVAGRITYSGNMTVTASETNATIQGLIGFNVSDRTNNLNDCEVGGGIILDGSMVFTIAGSVTTGVGFSLTGTISVNRRGPTGGLVPAGGGRVFLTLPRGGTRVTGSIFGTPVQ